MISLSSLSLRLLHSNLNRCRIEPDSLDAEVSGLVTSLPTSQNPKRFYRTSTSSGYSSHSPPLSATSYSCCNPATPQQGAVGVTATNAIRDQGTGLPVIHEGETIPRPIWPCIGSDPTKIHHEDCLEHNANGKGKKTFEKGKHNFLTPNSTKVANKISGKWCNLTKIE